MRTYFGLAFLVSVLAIPSSAQDARSILAHMLATTGWNSAATVNDAVLIGTVVYGEGGSANLEFKTRASGEVSMVLVAGSETSRIVATERVASSKAGGQIRTFPADELHQRLLFLFPPFAKQLRAPEWELLAGQDEIVGDQTCYKITFRHPGAPEDEMVLWVSKVSLLPVQVQHYLRSRSDASIRAAITTELSDYREANGFILPFLHREKFMGRVTHTVKISSISFDTGVSDADFTLSPQ